MAVKGIAELTEKEVQIVTASLVTQAGVFERAINKAIKDKQPELADFYQARLNEVDAVKVRFHTS